jgi:TPR repeat protein
MKLWRLAALLMFGVALPITSYAGLEDIRRDAERGDVAAQYELGILYEFGFNLADHDIEALAWYSIAADRGNAPAAQRRDLLKGRLTSAQQAQAEARRAELAARVPMAPAAAPASAPAEPAAVAPAPPTAAEPVPEAMPATPATESAPPAPAAMEAPPPAAEPAPASPAPAMNDPAPAAPAPQP